MFDFSISAKVPAGYAPDKANLKSSSQTDTSFLEAIGESYKTSPTAQTFQVPMSYNGEALNFLKKSNPELMAFKPSDEDLLKDKVEDLIKQISAMLGEEKRS